MKTHKLRILSEFPALSVYDSNNELVDISKPTGDADWQIIVVYRNHNCPVCTSFLNKLAGYRERLLDVGIDLAAVSAYGREQLEEHRTRLDVNFPLFYGLTIEQAQDLGLYISLPHAPHEGNPEFAEPGLFVINSEGLLREAFIANSAFMRPDLDMLVSCLEYVRNNA